MNTGGYYKAGKRYVPAVLIGGPYDWKDAIRLKLLDSEIITTKDKFVTEKPVSESQHRRNEKHAKRAAERAEFVKAVMAALAPGPVSLVHLASKCGRSPQMVYGRVGHWDEFKSVKLNDGKYSIQ